MKSLAPAGRFPTYRELLDTRQFIASDSELVPKNYKTALVRELKKQFSNREITLESSGKAAIESILLRLKKRYLCVSAYSCPDIVAAAVRAGYAVHPIDVETRTLDLKTSLPHEIDPGDAVLVLSNLFGMSDSLTGWKDQIACGLTVVDDACQAALSTSGGVRVGARGQSYGVLSFGRGKAISGIGGGAIIYPTAHRDRDALPDISSAVDFAKLVLFPILENPLAYGLVAALPFIGIGETHYDPGYSARTISEQSAQAALSQVRRMSEAARHRNLLAQRYDDILSRFDVALPGREREAASGNKDTLIRYPVLLSSAESRTKVFEALKRAGLGASKSYPTSLMKLCEAEPKLQKIPCPGADATAERLITLPLHEHVTAEIQDRIAAVFETEL